MNFVTDPFFYAVAIPAILMIGISKGGFAGLGVLGVPLITLAVPALQAAAIILPILCIMDIFSLIAYRRHVHWKNYLCLIPGALAGILFGTLMFSSLNDDMVRSIVGAVAVIFTLNYWLKPKMANERTGPSFVKGSFWGSLSGFTSFIAHAGGPPLQFYMLPQKLDKTVFIGTFVWFFFTVNFVKLVPYTYLGQFSSENLGTSLLLIPLAPLGVWLGIKAHKIIPEEKFYRLTYILLFVTGLKLLGDGLNGYLNIF